MTLQERFVARICAYMSRTGQSQSTVSQLVLGAPGTLKRLQEGKSCTLKTYELALAKLDELERALAASSRESEDA